MRPTGARGELYIEFDGQQLTVQSDAAEVLDFVAETYQAMLVPRVSASVGRLEIRRSDGEYVILSADSPDLHCNLGTMFIRVRDNVQRFFIRARPDLLWIHAGAVARGTRCLVISGPSGRGKSTMTTLLCERGWLLLSDELAPVRVESLEVVPFPQQPLRRIYPGVAMPETHVGILDRETVHVPDVGVHRDPASIGGVVFPVFRGGSSAEVVLIPPAEAVLELLKNCLNFVDHRAGAVDLASRIARAVRAHRILYGDPIEAARVLDGLIS